MHLIERLEKRAREVDQLVRSTLLRGGYDQEKAELRDLLEEAAMKLRRYEAVK